MNEFKFKGTLLKTPLETAVSVSWKSPSNIAIVKYWGKTGRQIPVNPSVSMTLSSAYTLTHLTAIPGNNSGTVSLSFKFEGKPNTPFGARISNFLSSISDIFPFLNQVKLELYTHNTFPHSSGIASSASSFSALALCLCSLEEQFSGKPMNDFFKKASCIARLGSGSACRSVYGGLSLWGKSPEMPGSSDLFAIPVTNIHPVFSTLRDAIIIVNSGEKKVSSSEGHERMRQHPFANSRVRQANANTRSLLKALEDGDRATFIRVTENEAMTLHALMMTSDPGFVLLEPDSIRIISHIREFREKTGLPICFTLDAGPNIHLMYFEEDIEQVQKLIVESLLLNDKQNNWIDDKFGTGPQKLN